MKQVLIWHGQVSIEQVPAPLIEAGHILVEVAYSLISTGTEISSVKSEGRPLVQQVLDKPERLVKLVDHLKSQGIQKTLEKVQNKLDTASPLGYSCSGQVIQVGQGVDDIKPGDLVACAGAGTANHAEIILAPRNLLVKIPPGCDLRSAASVTLGAIAMQGVRRSQAVLGDHVAVIGLGLLGMITIQLLNGAGCHVIGFDLDPERVRVAKELGDVDAYVAGQVDLTKKSLEITANNGVDATIITASSSSNSIAQQAMEITRQRGKVVVVGDIGLGLQRSPFYEKEIDFLISRSYGPGRYDPVYETQGQDYPYAYVRWTENRNMEEFLRLIALGKVHIDQIIDREFTIEQAEQAYQLLSSRTNKPLAVILSYPPSEAKQKTQIIIRHAHLSSRRIGVALVGAGNFARSIHLPNLMRLKKEYQIRAIVDADGVVAMTTAKQYDAEIATTRFEDVLDDEGIDLVIICTRHNTHSRLTLQALNAGKHVFVEKPLALNEAELTEIEEFYSRDNSQPILLTGFNRRFSPFIKHVSEIIKNCNNPMIINYRMNAGYIPLDHWVHGPEGGGRNLGEACHIYDLFTYLTGSETMELSAQHIHSQSDFYNQHDNFIANLTYKDGSVASLTYTAMGASIFPKEQMDVFVEGTVITLDDYQRLKTFGNPQKSKTSNHQNKGYFEELRALADSIQYQKDWPIPFWQLVQTTRSALLVEKYLRYTPILEPH